jgi:hypothetical protein
MPRACKQLRFESLEPRQVLSALGVVSPPSFFLGPDRGVPFALSQFRTLGIFAAPHSTSLQTTLGVPDGNNDDVEGAVSYSNTTSFGRTHSTLRIDAAGLYAGDDDVFLSVNGVDTVQLIPDSAGEIHITLSNSPVPGQQQLPANFPQLKAGDQIGFWEVSGALKPGTIPTAQVQAVLSDPMNGNFSGTTTYSSKTVSGVQHATFSVNVTGAMPNTTLAVETYQRQIATITTDANGSGHIFLSSDDGTLPRGIPLNMGFPSILMSREIVSIGNAKGVLADVTPPQIQF